MIRKIIPEYYPKYTKFSSVGSHFGASCLNLSRCGAFCLRSVFRNLWGWTDFGLPCGTLGPMFSTCWQSLGANLLKNSKIPEQPMAPTTPSKKQARIQQKLYR